MSVITHKCVNGTYVYGGTIDCARCRESIRPVVCAAIKHRELGLIICGIRHFDEIMGRVLERLGETKDWEQGFVDSYGEFLTRTEAMTRARGLRQLKHSSTSEELYSEDLY